MADQKGLEGVVAARTELSKVFGEEGRLIYRGYDIGDLAEHTSFEEVCYLLWHGDLPDRQQLEQIRSQFSDARAVAAVTIDRLRALPTDAHPMAVLRTAVSELGCTDSEAEESGEDANRRKVIRITAGMATISAAWNRIRNGGEPVEQDPELGHAENLL